MKFVTALTFVIAAALAVGCDSQKTASATPPSDVLNVAPMPSATPAPMPMMAQQPISDNQQVAFVQPVPTQSVAAPIAASSAKGSTYTVKKGDTLFSIAKNQLGSGRDWQKIVACNPGLSPQKTSRRPTDHDAELKLARDPVDTVSTSPRQTHVFITSF